MNKRPIVFDVDGVLADFVLGFTKLAATIDPSVRVRSTREQTQWDFVDFPDGVEIKTWELVKGGGEFWQRLPRLVTDSVLVRIDDIQFERDVYFATSRPGKNAKLQTERWLEQFVQNPTVIVTSRKGEFANVVNAAAIIDDKAGNAVYSAYEAPNTESFLLDAMYNQFDHKALGRRVTRVHSVAAFLDYVRVL